MASSTCCFCTHSNPARAKFCNECASPLHLKPCRLCDAVNARDAQACYRCEAALPEAPATVEPSPERIVAEADETLAELKRELSESPDPDTDVSREPVRSAGSEGRADMSAAFDLRAREPLTSAGEGIAGDRMPLAHATSDEQSAPASDVVRQQTFPLPPPVLEEEIAREPRLQQAVPPEDGRAATDDVREPPAAPDPLPSFDTTSVAADPADRQWRPERRSRRVALVIIAAALVVLPGAVYVMQSPALLDEWLGRVAVPSIAEPAPQGSPPAAPEVAAPAPAPAPVPAPATAVDNAPAALPTDNAVVTPPAQAAGVTTLLPPSPPVDSGTAFADEPTSITVTPERNAKATSTSRARSSAARARARDRATKPRPPAPALQTQRNDRPADADQAPRAEPCPESVAALGLCNR